jgi:hypothetical protein
VNGNGFLKLKTGTFWIDTIPLMKSRLAFQLATWLAFGEARHEAVKLALVLANQEAVRLADAKQTVGKLSGISRCVRRSSGQLPRSVRTVAEKHLTQQR